IRVGMPVAMVPDACCTAGDEVEACADTAGPGEAGGGVGAEDAALAAMEATSREVAAADASAGSGCGACAGGSGCGAVAVLPEVTGTDALAAAMRAIGSPALSPGHSSTRRAPPATVSKCGFSS